MDKDIYQRIAKICQAKIDKKGDKVGLSFYAFFENKNTDPDLLFSVAKWWIKTHKFDHFEKAIKIRDIARQELNNNRSTNVSIHQKNK